MINLFYIFLGIVALKLAINVTKYLQCKHYLKKYLDWVTDPTWELVEHKAKVRKLLQDAGVEDCYRGIVEPLGLMQIQTSNVSVMANFPNRREDFFVLTRGMLHQAIGVCSDPLELDNYDSSSRISPRKGKAQCQSVERLHRNSRPRLSWKN